MAQENDLIGSHFLELWRLNSRPASFPATATTSNSSSEISEEELEFEEAPTELDTVSCAGGYSIVGPDKLSVRYPSAQLHGHDVGLVQANKPAPTKRLIYYFEILVKNAGTKGQMSIGFTGPGYKMCRQPGWEANSYGYHGDDGFLYHGHGKGEAFGPTFTTGDTVGGGINYATQEIFFTKNGTLIGMVHKDVKVPLFPAVAVHSQNEEVSVNFGKDQFQFDIKTFEDEERKKLLMIIDEVSIPQNASYGIVRSYLQHYGYEETLKMFDVASRSTIPPIPSIQETRCNEVDTNYAINERRILRQLIRNGEIDEAFSRLHDWYPQIIKDDKSAIGFLLHCQKFIELVRVSKLVEAVDYARNEFDKFSRLGEFVDLVKDCAALLAYERPLKSSVGYLLGDSQREIVADAINSLILSINPNVKDGRSCLHSCLERLIRQLTACMREKRSLNGDQGEAFSLRRVLNSSNTKVDNVNQ